MQKLETKIINNIETNQYLLAEFPKGSKYYDKKLIFHQCLFFIA